MSVCVEVGDVYDNEFAYWARLAWIAFQRITGICINIISNGGSPWTLREGDYLDVKGGKLCVLKNFKLLGYASYIAPPGPPR